MIDLLSFENKIILLAVYVYLEVDPPYLEATVGYFDRELTQDVVVVSNEAESFTVKVPDGAKNLRGRAKKFRVRLDLC